VRFGTGVNLNMPEVDFYPVVVLHCLTGGALVSASSIRPNRQNRKLYRPAGKILPLHIPACQIRLGHLASIPSALLLLLRERIAGPTKICQVRYSTFPIVSSFVRQNSLYILLYKQRQYRPSEFATAGH
jgi:hypothetical protein